ncbi:hypothetical protein [Bosea sp. CS1GBMeth4]|uniref:hypothetical protein n=1 Tax=Bosea sp. CS1GBMeth4 TaxID=1892849 RepID=UPI001645DA54|nr:hypothetical protein [Bosea sp. CS1GBMeth4]
MRKSKMALCAAFASLPSHPAILKIRSELERGIENVFRLGLPFEFFRLDTADVVRFDDLSFYFSPEHDKIILVFVYPGSTQSEKLILPGVDASFSSIEIDEFGSFLEHGGVKFDRSDLNSAVSTIKLNGSVFYFDKTCSDRRIDITNFSVGESAL